MSAIRKLTCYPKYICLDRETAINFLCTDISRIPTCSKERITVFDNKKDAINSMRPEAKEALKNNDSFRFMVFQFYFSEICPFWEDQQKYKSKDKNDEPIVSDNKVIVPYVYTTKNYISKQDLFLAESWCFYKDKNKKLRYHKDYKIIDADLNDDLTIKIYE